LKPATYFRSGLGLRFALPLPRFVLHPLTSWIIAAVHVYLAYGHLAKLIRGDMEWVHIWKGVGALFGAYVFIALASRRRASSPEETILRENNFSDSNRASESQCHISRVSDTKTFQSASPRADFR